MNYIIFDLEWNQCPSGKENENKRLPFEIIEIGAVKLNDKLEYVEEFHQLVNPTVYNELHRITRDIIMLDMKDLKKGKIFKDAVTDFFEWCESGGEYIFASWGSMDLTELQRNCKFFRINHSFAKPLIYYDIQKLYSIDSSDGKTRVSLETAIDELELVKDIPFHSALSDAVYTSKVMQALHFEQVKQYSSIDTYVIPKNSEEEFTLNYGNYTKFVSHGYPDKDVIMSDGKILSTRCVICDKKVRRRIRWFSTNQKMYYCLAQCEKHGYIKGKIKIRKTENNQFFVTKVLKLTDEAGADTIREKQRIARNKRRERRHREKLRHESEM